MAALSEQLHPSGLSRTMQAELEMARRNRDEEATRYAQSVLLLRGVKETTHETDVRNRKAVEALQSLLARSEAAQLLRKDELVLELSKTDLESSQHHEERALVQRQIVPLLEQELERISQNVVEFGFAESVDKLATMARLAQQSTLLERQAVQDLAQSVFVAESNLLALLISALEKFRFSPQILTASESSAKWMRAQAEGMAAKTALAEKRLLKEVYYGRESVTALRTLHAQLLVAVENAEQRRMRLKMRQDQFEKAGPKMESVAKDYAALQTAIAETQWAIAEVNK